MIRFSEYIFNVFILMSIEGDFWERMELYDYPLDIQELSVTICSWHEKGSVKILPHPKIKSYIHPRAFNCFHEQQKYKLVYFLLV